VYDRRGEDHGNDDAQAGDGGGGARHDGGGLRDGGDDALGDGDDAHAGQRAGESRRLSGYVENTYGEAAAKVQLLGQALSQSGDVVGQRLQWVHGAIPGFGRVYYEIPGMPAADHYRVTVWSYERIQAPDGGGFVIR
jgi:hypothetical protein